MSSPSFFKRDNFLRGKKNCPARYYPVVVTNNITPFVRKTEPTTQASRDPFLRTRITGPKEKTLEQQRPVHQAAYQSGRGEEEEKVEEDTKNKEEEEGQVSPSSSDSTEPEVEVERLSRESSPATEEEQHSDDLEELPEDEPSTDPVQDTNSPPSVLKKATTWSPWQEPVAKKHKGFNIEN